MCNIWTWFIADHKLANEDRLNKLSPTISSTVAAITPWMIALNKFATSDELQLPAVQFLTLSLIIVWAWSVNPETAEKNAESVVCRTSNARSCNSQNSGCWVYWHERGNNWTSIAAQTVSYRDWSWKRTW